MKRILLALPLILAVVSCCKDPDGPSGNTDSVRDSTYRAVNTFAYGMMNTYYLWKDEVAEDLRLWDFSEDPREVVKKLRYKDETGADIDRWTTITDNYDAFVSNVSGNTLTTGLDFSLYYQDESRKTIVMVVNFTYEGSPAREAGLHRGDVILTLNGISLTSDNYNEVVRNALYGGNSVACRLEDGRTVMMNPRQMYLNPIICTKVFQRGDAKVGYLHYASFTMDSCFGLVDAFNRFKEAGVTELILDLRYNGGGYVFTSEVLASMIAPKEEVENGSIFIRQIYNRILTEAWKDSGESRFATEFHYTTDGGVEKTYATGEANPGLRRLQVLMTRSTASASECVICGLMPYMDVQLLGESSSGKYCGGLIVDAESWYDWSKDDLLPETYETGLKYADNWGIYVMHFRYADKDGLTRCMPDGFTPDITVRDDPFDGYELGDERETMLAAALSGGASLKRRQAAPAFPERLDDESLSPSFALVSPSARVPRN